MSSSSVVIRGAASSRDTLYSDAKLVYPVPRERLAIVGPVPSPGHEDLAPTAVAAAGRVAGRLVHEGTVEAAAVHIKTGSQLELVAHAGFSAAWAGAARTLPVLEERYASAEAIVKAEPVHVRRPDAARFPGTSAAWADEPRGSALFLPLKRDGKVIGVMGTRRGIEDPFGDVVFSYLKAVAAVCGEWLGRGLPD